VKFSGGGESEKKKGIDFFVGRTLCSVKGLAEMEAVRKSLAWGSAERERGRRWVGDYVPTTQVRRRGKTYCKKGK